MELTNDFTVDVGPERAWEVLTDVEAIAPCLPGAELTGTEGDDYLGTVKVKVGPITAQYKGTATFVEQDATARRLVLRADGRETRGQGKASATITAQLTAEGTGATKVSVVTDLSLSGKVAQFGRGVLADVSGNLMNQFADNLSRTVLGADPPAGAGTSNGSATSGGPSPATSSPPAPPAAAAPVDLMEVAGGSLAKRVAPALVLAIIAILVARALRRRS